MKQLRSTHSEERCMQIGFDYKNFRILFLKNLFFIGTFNACVNKKKRDLTNLTFDDMQITSNLKIVSQAIEGS